MLCYAGRNAGGQSKIVDSRFRVAAGNFRLDEPWPKRQSTAISKVSLKVNVY
jgi:hypothetical protein